MNISQNAGALYFLGTFATRSTEEIEGGALRIRRPGRASKFVERVSHVTFSAAQARRRGQPVRYVTERCVLRLTETGLEVAELAPGVELERDVLSQMAFRPAVAPSLRVMDAAIFAVGRMGLREEKVLSLRERVAYRPGDDLLYLNFEGLRGALSALDHALLDQRVLPAAAR